MIPWHTLAPMKNDEKWTPPLGCDKLQALQAGFCSSLEQCSRAQPGRGEASRGGQL